MNQKAYITATGVYHPKESIDNETLVQVYNEYANQYNQKHAQAIQEGLCSALEPSSSEFIYKASGIKSRYVMDKAGILDINRMCPYIPERGDDELSVQAEMALKGIEPCLKDAKKEVKDIDCVIVACSNMQRAYPAIAIEIQQALGINGFAFDMQVACSSATFGISMAANMVEAGQVKSVLVVSPEICSAHLDYTNRESHFIFGDACTAVLVESQQARQSEHAWQIISSHMTTVFSNNIRNNQGCINRCESKDMQPAPFQLFYQNGKKVFKEVVPKAFEHILAHCEKHQLNASDIDRYWLHQANSHMNQLIAKKLLGQEPTQEKAPIILDRYANTASAGSIIAFDHYQDDLKPGAKGVICSFGAGYSVGSLLVEKV